MKLNLIILTVNNNILSNRKQYKMVVSSQESTLLLSHMCYDITIIIVSGQDIMESLNSKDFVEQEIQFLCKKPFPVVKYFRFQNFHINHSSDLTRVLICGTKPVSLVTKYYT